MDNINNNEIKSEIKDELNSENTVASSRLCFACGATLDANKCCPNPDCEMYGIPQE